LVEGLDFSELDEDERISIVDKSTVKVHWYLGSGQWFINFFCPSEKSHYSSERKP
jgi:hypothetical protein